MKLSNFNKGQLQGFISITAGMTLFQGYIATGVFLAVISILLIVEYDRNKDQDLTDSIQSTLKELRDKIKKDGDKK